MKKSLIFIATFAINCLVNAQQLVNSGEYWFDGNYGSRTSIQITPSASYLYNSDINCNTLSNGLHIINMRFRQSDGRWSTTVSQPFLKTPPESTGDQVITAWEYWLDNAYSSKISQSVSPSVSFTYQSAIDLASVPTGIHVFNARFKQSNGSWSSVISQVLLKVPQAITGSQKIVAYEYWLDDAYQTKVSQQTSPADNYTFLSGIDFSAIPEGTHEFNIRFKQSSGNWSIVLSQIFVKVPLEVISYNIVGYEYWLDDAYSQKVSQEITPTADYFFASGIGLSAVSTGIHSFNMRFKQSNGQWSATVSHMFLKQPVLEGDNAITTYEYWFNEGFEDRTVMATPPVQLFTAINNLDIQSSEQFINIFHSRFKDRKNAWNYVDEYYYSIDLNLTVLLEGLYSNALNSMHKAQNENGDNFPGNIADTLTIQIREGIAPFNVLLNMHGVELMTDGTCHIQKYGTDLINPPNSLNTTYYLVVMHRNCVETWSQAITLGSLSAYSFTSSADQAYGSNQKSLGNGSVWGIYSGDVNQDGYIEFPDVVTIYNESVNGASGYMKEDLDGNGYIEFLDYIIAYNNSINAVGLNTPLNPAK
ncbi:MAG TPA: hypothetical protein PLM34_11370 [Lentimicrobium sp.]|nr:hypothetical protein [Lentimicrobium sp.]